MRNAVCRFGLAVAIAVLYISCQHRTPTLPDKSQTQDSTASALSDPLPTASPSNESPPQSNPLDYLDQFAAPEDIDSQTKEILGGCDTCHIDVADDFVGSLHFKEKIGCKKCHGSSDGHVSDENNDIKPDEVFARKDINRLCEVCHECSRLDEKPVQSPPKEKTKRKVCTDCHESHMFTIERAL
ncbi:MAG: hypothetical protein JXM70_25995 [Pirellulales bacterium]|nr:hypothetical protein [Pirellulales bacterium]